MVIPVVALALVVAVAAVVILVRGIVPLPGPARPDLPTGTLPSQPPLPDPPVVQQLTDRGLACQDEMTTPWRIKGCYRYESGRIVQVRMRFGAGDVIDKFQVQVYDTRATVPDRVAEALRLTDLMHAAAQVDEADRVAVRDAVTGGRTLDFVDGAWGELYVGTSKESTTIGVSRPDLGQIPTQPIVTDVAAFRASLEKQGFTCTLAGGEITCAWQQNDRYEVYGTVDGAQVTRLGVFYPQNQPAPVDHPVMVATYAALLAGGGPHVEAVRQGLARMAMDRPELVFSGGYRVSYWDIQYAVATVDFV